MDELSDECDEYWMHKVEAEVFERCISEISADLAAVGERRLVNIRAGDV